MDAHHHQVQKVYVVVGNDHQDGFKTLYWTLQNWKSQPISIVILHVTCDISRDLVYIPLGCKLPATSVSDEVLEHRKKYEEGMTDVLLSNYKAFCGEVKVETKKIKSYDHKPIHEVILDLISRHRITKLVMGIPFMKSSSGKPKAAIRESILVDLHKPDYCELFIIRAGKLEFLKGDNVEGVMVDDQGVTIARMRVNLVSSLAKMFSGNAQGRSSYRLLNSSRNLNSSDSQNRWEHCLQDIETYFQHLLSLNLDEEKFEGEDEIVQTRPVEAIVAEYVGSNMTVAEKMESVRSKIKEAEEVMELQRKETKANAERYKKAEWAIRLCTTRAEKLESQMKEELTSRIELQKRLDDEREQLYEVIRDVEESRSRLSSLLELQSELSNKLQLSTLAKGHVEKQLEKAVVARAEMVGEIEELRRQRDILHRRIEFCKEKNAIGMVTRSSELISCGYREFTAKDIRVATDDFSERLRLKTGGDWTNVYRGRLNHSSAVIKLLSPGLSDEDFQAKVKFRTNIRHPHLVAMMGFCSDPKCIVFEYMHNGNLRDILFSSQRNYRKHGRVLGWHDRIRIAHEVCSGLGYLHLAEPRPIVHGRLTPANILLDRNLVAKISGLGLTTRCGEYDERWDVRAFGVVLLHLLTGRNWAGLVEEAMMLDRTALVQVLDEMAGEWPLDVAEEVAMLAMKCLSVNDGPNNDLRIRSVMEELDTVKKKADGLVARGVCEVVISRSSNKEDSRDIPSVFLCPIFQEPMKNPHLAADGFSYELEAIEEWLGMGHDTSPMTNLKLKHKFLTPNLTLRSLIQEWLNKNS